MQKLTFICYNKYNKISKKYIKKKQFFAACSSGCQWPQSALSEMPFIILKRSPSVGNQNQYLLGGEPLFDKTVRLITCINTIFRSNSSELYFNRYLDVCNNINAF